MIVKTITMSCVIKLLGSSHQPVRHAAQALLLELSKSQHACEKIGTARGAILMLVTAKYNRELDSFASETSDQILRNLEKCPENIKQMAESGLLEPLLGHLAEGNSLLLFSPKFMKHSCYTSITWSEMINNELMLINISLLPNDIWQGVRRLRWQWLRTLWKLILDMRKKLM
jgi:hypothetical protein